MIKVTTLYDKDTLKGFKIIGHADYGEHGKDIVCAAVSMLAYTTVNSLDSYNYEVDFSDDEEIMELLVKNPSHDSEVILNTFSTGIRTLTQSYGDFVEAYTTIL
ncbi:MULTISPECIES: ribosomal-processing cysteine protease Prp [Anaerococcus]|uniref:Ribosomal processing cysteine protease Prp n=1 Tax=Anaerococcus nagyae TaxID=1755241 RepID=A0A3E2TIP2_9FIRM|nr:MULTISPECIES: ribosomal-processing cysteine protease Prp [Anaerococcus]MBP2069721.1 uncharacterized protein YsxB (DUF464 family) [Anaerococcus nagyae]MDU2354023.1 ribosomal-processing cysteine protease Prp [Anaerococcus sp.]MDU2565596.1 ribosomal-processing cysteine protease Prp [Anaerococcus sp.]MDU3211292.1 ribosomal-processing cysteine protease Prp [Anaerococcus sp.]RGB76543.1 ribosomal-processing cysteine protease Prp [Anaerococcus nagyae]